MLSEIILVFSDKTLSMSIHIAIENTMISRIYGHGRGWAFSKKDFSAMGESGSIDRALSRMAEKGVIRRVMRGLQKHLSLLFGLKITDKR